MDDYPTDLLLQRIIALENKVEFMLKERQDTINKVIESRRQKAKLEAYMDRVHKEVFNPHA